MFSSSLKINVRIFTLPYKFPTFLLLLPFSEYSILTTYTCCCYRAALNIDISFKRSWRGPRIHSRRHSQFHLISTAVGFLKLYQIQDFNFYVFERNTGLSNSQKFHLPCTIPFDANVPRNKISLSETLEVSELRRNAS